MSQVSQIQRQYFGTDGVRGPFGGPVINEVFAARLGIAAAAVAAAAAATAAAAVAKTLARAGDDGKRGDAAANADADAAAANAVGAVRVVIGRDTRESGWRLQQAVAAGLAAGGMRPVLLGVVPTPALALAVTAERASLGVMITASHNPACDNGIKFFNATGLKLSDAQELAIERALPDEAAGAAAIAAAAGTGSGLAFCCDTWARADGLRPYFEKIAHVLTPNALDGWRVALDTANGATCATSPVVLGALGADIVPIGNEPNGRNINDGVGSEHPQKLAARVRETGARLGVAHDGDGDRCILCDERGAVLDGDEILAILALHALASGRLAAGTLVATVQSNLGLDAALRAAGGRVARSQVGDRHVAEKMRETGATLGGESSGHIIFSDISPAGDGLLAALKTIEVMLATGKPLSELRGALKKFPQATKNLRVREKPELGALPGLTAAIAALERELGGAGRVLARYSGTEPKLRLLVEGPAEAVVGEGIARLEAAARRELVVEG